MAPCGYVDGPKKIVKHSDPGELRTTEGYLRGTENDGGTRIDTKQSQEGCVHLPHSHQKQSPPNVSGSQVANCGTMAVAVAIMGILKTCR